MSIPPQSCLSCFLSKPSHLCCPSDVGAYSFLILSILVTPSENRNIFMSVTSISASCHFVSATVFNPYNIAGLTATLYTFPFSLAGTRLSQIIRDPDILLHPFHPACTLFFTSLPHSPLLCTDDPRFLKSSTFATYYPCISTVPLPLPSLPLIHTHVFCLSSIDFHLSSLQSISPALQFPFYTFLALAADHM